MIWVGLVAWLVVLIKRARWGALAGVPPVFLDGALWVVIAMGQAAQGELGSEAAFKYVDPNLLYWAKFSVNILTQGATGLKMFRSTSYGKHLAAVEAAAFPPTETKAP